MFKPTSAFTPRSSVYTPAAPVQVISNTVLSQDVVVSAEVLVAPGSINPVAPFVNPTSGLTEGLAVSQQGGDPSSELYWVGRNAAVETGWQTTQLFGGVAAIEVAAGSAANGDLYGFYSDAEQVWSTQFLNGTWADPVSICGTPATNISVAYSPGGRVVVYAATTMDSNPALLTAYQASAGAAFTSLITPLNVSLSGSFDLVMQDELNWTLAANMNGVPTVFTAALGEDAELTGSTAQGFTGTLSSVVLGFWCPYVNSIVFLLVDTDGTLQFWNRATNTALVIQSAPNADFVSAVGYVDDQNNAHVYTVGAGGALSAMHQTGWSEGPVFAPPIPLDSNIGGVAADLEANQSPTLFAVGTDWSLRMHAQDPTSGLWLASPVLQSSTSSYALTRYRTEINFVDATGVPLANYAVSVQAASGSSAIAVAAGGNAYLVSSLAPTAMMTDAMGKLTIATPLTNGLSVPVLQVSSADVGTPVSVSPSGPLFHYLNGTGTWNPANPDGGLTNFDAGGSTLQSAQVQGSQLAPSVNAGNAAAAAQAVQQTAALGLGAQPMNGPAGFSITVNDDGTVSIQIQNTTEDLASCLHRQSLLAPKHQLGDIFSFAGDLWSAFMNGLAGIGSVVVDLANATATFAAQLGGELVSGIELAISAVEQVACFIGTVFQMIGAAIEDLVSWLEAMFDFGNIWNTMLVFQNILQELPSQMISLANQAQGSVNSFFSNQASFINGQLASIIAAAPASSTGSQSGAQPQGTWQNSSTSLSGNASLSDAGSNPHSSWLQDKVTARSPAVGGDNSNVDATMASVATALGNAWADAASALSEFEDAVGVLITDPSQIGSLGVQDIVKGMEDLVSAVMNVAAAIGDQFVGAAQTLLTAIQAFLNVPITDPILLAIWDFISPVSPAPPLSFSYLFALLGAFPTTVIYFLMNGNAPFPNGEMDVEAVMNRRPGDGSGTSQTCGIVAGILQCLSVIPVAVADLALPLPPPSYLSFLRYAFSAVEYFLWNGSPSWLADVDWSSGGAQAAYWYGGCILPLLNPYLQAVSAAYNNLTSFTRNTFLTMVGLMSLLYGVYEMSVNEENASDWQVGYICLDPLSNLMRWLLIEPLVTGGQYVVIDILGMVGGAVCRIFYAVDDWDTSTQRVRLVLAQTTFKPGLVSG